MGRYTPTIHELLKSPEVTKWIKEAMNSYPIYKATNEQLYGFIPTREELNKKILDHYRFYEIGSETVERFLFNLETTLNEIMPYYNQLYKSLDVINGLEDIFGNLDIKETFEQTTTGESSSSSKDNLKSTTTTDTTSEVNSTNNTDTDMTTSGRNVNSKTPQSQLSAKTIDGINSASEMNWNENTDSSSSESSDKSTSVSGSESESIGENSSNASSESSGTNKHTLTRKGNQGVNTYAHDMLEFRQLFLNIEQQIINDPELVKCFMTIW